MSLNSPHSKRTFITFIVLASILLAACGASPSDQSQDRTFKIGIVSGGSNFDGVLAGYKAGMAELGYTENKKVVYTYDGPANSPDKLGPNVQSLLAAKVDLIVALGTPAAQTATKLTSGTTVPVIFLPVSDPVASGIVQSISKPGGSATGIATGVQVHGLRLQWLLKSSPKIKHVYVPFDTADAATASGLKAIKEVAPNLGIELVTQEIRTADDVSTAITKIPADADAIFLLAGIIVGSHLNDFIKASLEHKLPLSAPIMSHVDAGALLSYSFGDSAVGKQAARLSDKILRGAKPSDLPVETSEFFLAVNLKTAQAIGLNIPDDMLRQAANIVR